MIENVTHTNLSCYPCCTVYRGRSRISSQGGAFKKIAPREGRLENFWGISCENSLFYAKKSYFFQFQGGAHQVRPLDLPLVYKYEVLQKLLIPTSWGTWGSIKNISDNVLQMIYQGKLSCHWYQTYMYKTTIIISTNSSQNKLYNKLRIHCTTWKGNS